MSAGAGDPPFVEELAAAPPSRFAGALAATMGARAPAGEAPPRPPMELVRFADMLAPNLETRSLIKGFLDASAIALVYGESGCGKTFFTLDLALCVAEGREWFGRRTAKGRVIYVAAEAGRSIKNRVAAWAQSRWDEAAEIDFDAVVSPVDLCHLKNGDVERLITAVGTADLVIIDTVSRALAGGNENAPDDMGAFVGAMDKLRDRLGCAVVAVHHVGKDASRGGRGHSLLHCAVDTEIEVERRDSGVSVATVTKQRDGPGGAEIAFALRQVDLGIDQEGDAVTSCVVEGTDYVPAKTAALSPSLSAALKVLKSIVSEKGVTVPFGDLEVRGVKVDEWRRAMAVNGQFGEDKSPQFRTAWSRAQGKLAEGRHIVFGEGFVWPTEVDRYIDVDM